MTRIERLMPHLVVAVQWKMYAVLAGPRIATAVIACIIPLMLWARAARSSARQPGTPA